MSNTQKTLLERIKAMPTPSDYPLIAAILTEAAAEIERLQAENVALKARITELESRQITEHGTVEYGGLTWRFYRSDERENDRGHWATDELEPFGVFIWARNNGFYINADEYGTVNFSSVFEAMQAAIDYATGDSDA